MVVRVSVAAAALSADGDLALAGYDVKGTSWRSKEKRLVLWDAKTGKRLWIAEGPETLWPVGFLRNQKHALVYSRTVAELWDVEKGVPVRVLFKAPDYIRFLALSADGLRAVAVHAAPGGDYFTVWDVDTGRHIRTLGNTGHTISSLAVNHIGTGALVTYLRSTDDNDRLVLEAWNLVTGSSVQTFDWKSGLFAPVVLSADGRRAVCNRQRLHSPNLAVLWEMPVFKELRTLDAWGTAYGFAEGSRALIINDEKGVLQSLDLAAGRTLWKVLDAGAALSFSANSNRIFTAWGGYAIPNSGGSILKVRILDSTDGHVVRALADPAWIPVPLPY